jgi:hypothetical protein
MKITGSGKKSSLCWAGVEQAAAAGRIAKAGKCVLAFGALWMLAGSCWAAEPAMPTPLSASALPVRGATGTEISRNHRFDLVIVEPQGRRPQGYGYRIVLDSAMRGAESSLELAAEEGGLVVIARDVDGIGNDLDLIIKSAKSFTPIGVWINNHHGGFTKADAGIYAPSIWSDGPFVLSPGSAETFQGALVLWHQSYIHPVAQRCPGEGWMLHGLVEPANLDLHSRRTADPQQTRGPPSSFLVLPY